MWGAHGSSHDSVSYATHKKMMASFFRWCHGERSLEVCYGSVGASLLAEREIGVTEDPCGMSRWFRYAPPCVSSGDDMKQEIEKPKFWIQYGNMLTLLLVVLLILSGFFFFRTEPERSARHNALKISGWLEYALQEELLLHDVHVAINSNDKTGIIVSGTVTNRNDLTRIQKLYDDCKVNDVHMTLAVAVLGENSSDQSAQ